ncbi:MAG: FimV family protein, partial [Methylophilaceae bacterium]
MHNSKIKRITLAVCLALMPFSAGAAGLGKMTVMSGLGEPLNAEIEIAANKEELSSLSARIAPSETYAEQGVERASSLGAVRVELSRKPDGTPILKLSSPQPINEPFLDMLVQVDWPTGRLLREYTALLDPPGYGDRTASGSEAVVEGTQLPAAAVPSKKNTTKNASRVASKAAQAEPTGSDTYVTRRGDTLRNVARQMQVDDVTLEQMLVGLYRSNRDAFMGDNMNQLKVGQIMRAPREDELRAINPQDALQEVRVHTANWNAYRNDVAQAVAQSKAAPAETQPQTSGGKITAQAEDRAAPPATGPRDVVKLSKSDAGAEKPGAGTGAPAISDDKMRALEEESTSQEKAIAEVNERIAFFEKQIQDMQKLLLVQNQILSDLQKGKPVDQLPGAEAALAPAQSQDQQPPVEQAAPAKKAMPATKPPVETPAEPTLLDRLIQDPLMMGAAGGALLLLVGGWLLLRRQRRKNLDSFEKGILTSSGLKSDTVFGTTAGAAVDTGETSFMSDFSHRNGAGMIDTNDVDPISEAEVYMAYGRDAQAEEILKDAIVKEPKRYELHLKLLEIYANRKDAVAFETLAGELYATLGTIDPVWSKVADMGRALEPENPMYAAVAGGDAAASATPASSVSSTIIQASAGAAGAVAALGMTSSVDDERMQEEVEAQDNSLDFDLGMLGADDAEVSTGIEKESDSAEVEPLPDLGAFETPAVEMKEEAVESAADMDLQFELPEPAAEANVQLDATDLGLPEAEPSLENAEEEISFELPLPDIGANEIEVAQASPASETPVSDFASENELSLPEL